MSPLNKLKSFITPSDATLPATEDETWHTEANETNVSPADFVETATDDDASLPEASSYAIEEPLVAYADEPSFDADRDAGLTSANLAQSESALHSENEPRELGPTPRTNNLSNIRADLAQLNTDMSSGERFYAQSIRRINDLINYAYETEANLSSLEKLEPENARLKEELQKAKQRANDESMRAESLKSKAETYEARYVETRQTLEKAQLSLAKTESERKALDRKISDTQVEIAGLTNSNRTIRNELAMDRQSHEKLSAQNLSLSSELSVALSEKLELEKRHMDVSARVQSLTEAKTELERLLAQTRSLHRATEEQNVSLRAEMEQVLADIQVFKQQFDTSTRNRDAELNSLRAKLADMQTEIRIKEDVVEHGRQELEELRAKHEAAHRGRKNLMSHIEEQKKQLETLKTNAQQAKIITQDSNSTVIALQAEIDQLRRINSAQSGKLKKYMAINAIPVSATTASAVTTRGMKASSVIADAVASSSLASQASPIKEPMESRARRRAERLARETQAEEQTLEALSSAPPSADKSELDRQLDELKADHTPFANGTAPRDVALESLHDIDLSS